LRPEGPGNPIGHIRVPFIYVTDKARAQALTATVERALIETCKKLGLPMIIGQIQRYVPLDKYAVENALPKCLRCGSCCTGYYNVYLTEQDIAEGIAHDVRQPYMLRQRADGTCFYFDTSRRICKIYEKRPIVCRQFTCARDSGQIHGRQRKFPHANLRV
jgi:hypothetical protein